MIHFIFYALTRLLSGFKNGAYQAKNYKAHNVLTCLLILAILVYPFVVGISYKVAFVVFPVASVFYMWQVGMNKQFRFHEASTEIIFAIYGVLLGADVLMYLMCSAMLNWIVYGVGKYFYVEDLMSKQEFIIKFLVGAILVVAWNFINMEYGGLVLF